MQTASAKLYNLCESNMLRLICFMTVVAVAMAATTVTTGPQMTTMPPMSTQILYDFKHHKAMIVMADGCYEYHMNHADVQAAKVDATKAVLEARMVTEMATMVNKQETGHHHIDHMSQDIKTACASLPVYSWEVPQPVGK